MSDTYSTPTAEPAPSAPPPPSYEPSYNEPPAPPQNNENFDSSDFGSTYSGEGRQDGKAKVHATPYSAAKELGRRRSERDQTLPELLEGTVEEVKFVDGRPADQTVDDIREVAGHLAEYRAQQKALAQELLTGQAPQAEGQPQQQPQQQPELSPYEQINQQRDVVVPQILSQRAQLAEALAQVDTTLRGLGADSDIPRGPEHAAIEQARAEVAHTAAVRAQAESQLLELKAALVGINLQEFAHLRTPEDVQKLLVNNPVAFNRFAHLYQTLPKIDAALQQEQATRQHAQAQQYHQWARAQDALLGNDPEFPEFAPNADPRVTSALQNATVKALKDVGFSDQELAAAWQGAPISLRDVRVQRFIGRHVRAAGQWQSAQQRVAEATRRPVPPVQKPGTANGGFTHRDVTVSDLSRQLDNTTSPLQQAKIAGRLLAERRRNAR